MYLKNLLIAGLFCTTLFGSNTGGKFIVVDNATYDKVKVLNMLDGGIKQQFVLSSTRLLAEDIKTYYPEYLLYSGEKCTIVNDVIDLGRSSNPMASVVKLQTPSKIDEEVKKIKLLQILVNSSNKDEVAKNSFDNVSQKIIKAIGIICEGELILRGKRYVQDELIGNIKIESISTLNSTVYVRER